MLYEIHGANLAVGDATETFYFMNAFQNAHIPPRPGVLQVVNETPDLRRPLVGVHMARSVRTQDVPERHEMQIVCAPFT